MPNKKEIKIYMSYSYPVDPTFVKALGDMDINTAISSTLLDYDADASGQISSGLAESWSVEGEKTIRLKLNPKSKWSDGSSITAPQIKESLTQSMERVDISKGLSQQIKSIQIPDEQTVVFILNIKAKDSSLLMRLCEPTYGIVKIIDGDIELGVSSGPFVVSEHSKNELTLFKNKYWYEDSSGLAHQITIRQRQDKSERDILKEGWSNLIHSESLQTSETTRTYQANDLNIWSWKSHRTLLAIASRTNLKTVNRLLQFLNSNLDKSVLTESLSGFELGQQLYPPGYLLNKQDFSCDTESELPDKYKIKPIEVLLTSERVSRAVQNNLVAALKKATGIEPQIIDVALKDTFSKIMEGDFDFYFGTIAISNPNPDGSLDYLFRNKLVPSGEENSNFIARLDKALNINDEKEKNSEYKSILETASCEGFILPILYFHTTSMASRHIDLTKVGETDETVEFSKVRFK